MRATTPEPLDPGATPPAARALAPDLARGGMLLLIAVANAHTFLYSRDVGVRGYPRDLDPIDRVVVLVQMLLVDGRAYPLFALLFGYGVSQLARRRAERAVPGPAVQALVRRRGGWLLLIGLAHGLLLFSGDIVGAYGLIAVLLAGVLVACSDRLLLVVAVAGIGFSGLLSTTIGIPVPARSPHVASVATADPLAAALERAVEWIANGLLVQALAVFGAVALGAWAGRRRLLDEPSRHRLLLLRTAGFGIGGAVLLGLPFALLTAEFWTAQPLGLRLAGAALHGLGGFAAGSGYAAVFGLVAIRYPTRPGPLAGALAACGRRSLSCYLAQSVAFVALLPAWTAALGAVATVTQATLIGTGTWAVVLVVAVLSERVGLRGPAESLLRRLTYRR